MIRLAVCGDRHVDRRHPAYTESLRCWDWAIADAITQQVHGFIGLGDVMEVGVSPADIDAIAERYVQMLADGRFVWEVAGNHEPYGGLRWARHVASGKLLVADTAIYTLPIPGATAVLIPYCRRGHPPFDVLDGTDSLQDYYTAAGQYVGKVIAEAQQANPGVPLIVAGHWTPAGFEVGPSELELTASKEMVVPLEMLASADLVLVGHIHKAQQIGNVVGVGSMFRTTFAERDQEKSYVIVTISDDRVVTWERRVIPTRPMREIRISGERAAETVAHIMAGDPDQDCKIIVETTPDDKTVYAELFSPLDNLPGRFPWEVIRPSLVVTRAPEIEQSVTMANDFEVWLPLNYPDLSAGRRAAVIEKVESL